MISKPLETIHNALAQTDEVHCVSVRIQSLLVSYLPIFGLNTNIYRVNFRILSKCGKIHTRKTENVNTSYAVTETETCRGIVNNICSENIHKKPRSVVGTLSNSSGLYIVKCFCKKPSITNVR